MIKAKKLLLDLLVSSMVNLNLNILINHKKLMIKLNYKAELIQRKLNQFNLRISYPNKHKSTTAHFKTRMIN